MSYILNIETSTTVCSASLSENGRLITSRELDAGFTHAENLHLFIGSLIAEADISFKHLSAIAISKGPGSYTGLRIGTSTAKGLAYTLGLPLISVDTLMLMSSHADIQRDDHAIYCPMIDARRMEVYTALYDSNLNQCFDTEALIVDENSIQKFITFSKVYFFGDGAPKCLEILKTLPNMQFIPGIVPSAKYMCPLSYEKYKNGTFEDVAYFEPFYLKDFLFQKK